MSNKHPLLHLAILSLVTGIPLSFGGEVGLLSSSVSSGGGVLLLPQSPSVTLTDTIHAAAPAMASSGTETSVELSLGILFIVLGFLFYGLWKAQAERRVPVRVVRSEKHRTVPLRVSRGRKWYWMEIRL